MEQGIILKLVSYYIESEKIKTEIERAKNEFFDAPSGSAVLEIDEKYKSFFMEWLVFDFRLQSDKSLLEDYYFRNPRNLSIHKMQIYKDLQENVYGMIEAQKIYLDEGMEVLMLHTGKKYFVRERAATFQLKKGNIFFGRIGKVGDHYELVGSDSFHFNIHFDSRTKKYFIGNVKMTPKDAMKFLEGNEEENNNWSEQIENIDIEEIKKELDDFLDEIDIGKMVSADLIQKWLREIDFKRKNLFIIDVLVGLVDNFPSQNKINKLLELVEKLANHSPRKALKGKSPNEMAKGNGFGSKGFDFSITRMGGEWTDYANKAMRYLKDGEISKSLDEYEKTFKVLLKEETIGRYIFSVFANMAVCYLYFGMEFTARKLLKIALEINKNYIFAKNLLATLDSGERAEQLADSIRFVLKQARTKKMREFWKKVKDYSDADLCKAYYDISLADCEDEWISNPARKYYDFLKKLEINFDDVKK